MHVDFWELGPDQARYFYALLRFVHVERVVPFQMFLFLSGGYTMGYKHHLALFFMPFPRWETSRVNYYSGLVCCDLPKKERSRADVYNSSNIKFIIFNNYQQQQLLTACCFGLLDHCWCIYSTHKTLNFNLKQYSTNFIFSVCYSFTANVAVYKIPSLNLSELILIKRMKTCIFLRTH